jgi:hypothetical protein
MLDMQLGTHGEDVLTTATDERWRTGHRGPVGHVRQHDLLDNPPDRAVLPPRPSARPGRRIVDVRKRIPAAGEVPRCWWPAAPGSPPPPTSWPTGSASWIWTRCGESARRRHTRGPDPHPWPTTHADRGQRPRQDKPCPNWNLLEATLSAAGRPTGDQQGMHQRVFLLPRWPQWHLERPHPRAPAVAPGPDERGLRHPPPGRAGDVLVDEEFIVAAPRTVPRGHLALAFLLHESGFSWETSCQHRPGPDDRIGTGTGT